MEAPIWEEPKQSINVETWPPTEASRDELRAEVSTAASDELSDIQEAPPVPVSTGEASERRLETTPSPLPIDAPQTPSSLTLQVISTPSPKLTRPVFSSHRTSARHKIPDQPVTLPLSFGTGIEKVGMQFGSLSVGDSPSQSSKYVFHISSFDELNQQFLPKQDRSRGFRYRSGDSTDKGGDSHTCTRDNFRRIKCAHFGFPTTTAPFCPSTSTDTTTNRSQFCVPSCIPHICLTTYCFGSNHRSQHLSAPTVCATTDLPTTTASIE